MSTTKKFIYAVLLTLALSVAVGACGSSDSSDSKGSTGGAEAGDREPTTDEADGGAVPDLAFTGFESKLPDCYEEPKKEALTVGYSSPSLVNEATATEAEVIKAEVEELGGTLVMEDAGGQPDKQVSQIQRLISRSVDALIVFPLDAQALRPVLTQAESAGIPVLAIASNSDGPDPGPGFATQVLFAVGEGGYVQAKKMAELVPEGSEIAQMNLIVPVGTIEKLTAEGKRWAEEFGLVPVSLVSNQTDDIAGGEAAMTGLLGESPNIAGLIAYNDESATGAYAAARSQGKDLVLIGSNGGALAYSSIESGKIAASVQYPLVDIARCAVKGAYALAQGKNVPQAVVPGEMKLLDEDTIAESPTWDEQIEEIYGTSE